MQPTPNQDLSPFDVITVTSSGFITGKKSGNTVLIAENDKYIEYWSITVH